MRTRLDDLIGEQARRHLGDDLPRRVRPHAARGVGAARLPVELHDLRPGRPGAARQAVPRGPRARPEAVRPARRARGDLEREERARVAGDVQGARRLVLRPDRRRGVRAVPAAAVLLERRRLRRHAHADSRRARAVPGGARAVAEGVPIRARRRVPGHEPRAVPAAPASRWKTRESVQRRRPGPGDFFVPRCGHSQHRRVRKGLPRDARDPARAELPLDEHDPARGQPRDRAQHGAQGEEPLLRPRRGRGRAGPRDRGRARRGALRRRRRSPGWSRRARTAPRSRSSTGRTRSPESWKTCSSARTSPTR